MRVVRVRSALRAWLSWAVAVTFGLASTELVASFLVPASAPKPFVPDQHVGFRSAPGARVWMSGPKREFGNWFRTNARGNPDIERSQEKPAGVYRIAMIGDSMLEGAQVTAKERFSSLLEKRLNPNEDESSALRVEVLNFGTSGYGPAQEMLYYENYVRQFDPDAVVVVLLPGNDVRNSSYALEVERCGRPYIQPFFELDTAGELRLRDRQYYQNAVARHEKLLERSSKNWIRRLALYRLASGLRAYFRNSDGSAARESTIRQLRTDLELFDSEAQANSAEWQDAWGTLAAIVKRFHSVVVDDGAKFHVVVANGVWEVNAESRARAFQIAGLEEDERYRWEMPSEMTDGILRDIGLSYTNLLPTVAARAREADLNFPYDGHYTPEGHRAVADVLLPVLERFVNDREVSRRASGREKGL